MQHNFKFSISLCATLCKKSTKKIQIYTCGTSLKYAQICDAFCQVKSIKLLQLPTIFVQTDCCLYFTCYPFTVKPNSAQIAQKMWNRNCTGNPKLYWYFGCIKSTPV